MHLSYELSTQLDTFSPLARILAKVESLFSFVFLFSSLFSFVFLFSMGAKNFGGTNLGGGGGGEGELNILDISKV